MNEKEQEIDLIKKLSSLLIDNWQALKDWAKDLKEKKNLTYRELFEVLDIPYKRSLVNYLLPSGKTPSKQPKSESYILREKIENAMNNSKLDSNKISDLHHFYVLEDLIYLNKEELKNIGFKGLELVEGKLQFLINQGDVDEFKSHISKFFKDRGLEIKSEEMEIVEVGNFRIINSPVSRTYTFDTIQCAGTSNCLTFKGDIFFLTAKHCVFMDEKAMIKNKKKNTKIIEL